ncbi:Glycine--tRNA ligase [Candidatus Hepatoplasma crinochetorum Av]|uniref:glycine--tRNA ligase n=1 Tax=Candidatus Hepatoplasma crinochetorum Av TaxID=1427984 RepID=W8GSQ9_9MOLU|nr:glycine--tRNA ligase [Candidatus Hepatoplasma crinochetorum]AHK22440.1 Glycine--tRNA ligase [Candidatus Hepatoplasma crinochetorum Av]
MNKKIDDLIIYLKEKGFIYPSSIIYGGLANTWDFGPLGAMIKINLKNYFNHFFIDLQQNNYYFDSSIILSPKVWEASGHLKKFKDYVITCLNDNSIYRVDELIEEYTNYVFEDLKIEEAEKIIKNEIKLKKYQDKTKWSNISNFDLMFKTNYSKIDSKTNEVYFRPETAQGIFINFKNICDSFNLKLPFGIGQVGKSFRNEITPKNFIFRTKEFEQLELEYFTYPNQAEQDFSKYLDLIDQFLINLGFKKEQLIKYNVPKNKLAHYSKKTIDYEYEFPFGKKELLGIANRGDFDLKNHSKFSKKRLQYFDTNKNEWITPYIIETSIGVERLLFAIFDNLYIKEEKRNILKLPFFLSPYKIAICPLTDKLNQKGEELLLKLKKSNFGAITLQTGGSIGKRYRKQDEIGTFFIITIDFETEKDQKVTIRERDTKNQTRIKISEIEDFIKDKLK